MSLSQDYLNALASQKALIDELGGSRPGSGIPGLTPEEVSKRLADSDENLKKTKEYYEELAKREAEREESEAKAKGIKETDAQKKSRRDAKKKEARKKIEETTKKFVAEQKDFVNEQISIIDLNYTLIQRELKDIPKGISVATATSLQPAAVGAAAPNPIFNLGLYYQSLSSLKAALGNIKIYFLNILIAADKIRFVLPSNVTNLLQTVVALEKNVLRLLGGISI
jgi:actin-related protein